MCKPNIQAFISPESIPYDEQTNTNLV